MQIHFTCFIYFNTYFQVSYEESEYSVYTSKLPKAKSSAPRAKPNVPKAIDDDGRWYNILGIYNTGLL